MYMRSKASKKKYSLFNYNLSQNSIFSLLGPSMYNPQNEMFAERKTK